VGTRLGQDFLLPGLFYQKGGINPRSTTECQHGWCIKWYCRSIVSVWSLQALCFYILSFLYELNKDRQHFEVFFHFLSKLFYIDVSCSSSEYRPTQMTACTDLAKKTEKGCKLHRKDRWFTSIEIQEEMSGACIDKSKGKRCSVVYMQKCQLSRFFYFYFPSVLKFLLLKSVFRKEKHVFR
jgi:hypothetical protein